MEPGNCNICHKYFDSIVKTNIHIQRTHTYGPEKQQRTYECVTCGKGIRTRSNLSQHMRSHNKIGMEKMNPVSSVLPCNNCKKLCKRRWNLKGHMILKHTKVALGAGADFRTCMPIFYGFDKDWKGLSSGFRSNSRSRGCSALHGWTSRPLVRDSA